MVNVEAYRSLRDELDPQNVTLVAVSKTKPASDILELYNLGHRDFGENYVQEMVEKAPQLPNDIRWHFIGHLQRNKVKQIASFVHLVHGVDSLRLLEEINNQANKTSRTINFLLQVHISGEETKFGLNETELVQLVKEMSQNKLQHVKFKGLMGMASFIENMEQVRSEDKSLKKMFDQLSSGKEILSMGMTADYRVAVEEGSNMVRIGTMLFGER